MNPDGTASDKAVSHDVCTWIVSVPGVTAPNVIPLIVITNKDNAAMTDSEVDLVVAAVNGWIS